MNIRLITGYFVHTKGSKVGRRAVLEKGLKCNQYEFKNRKYEYEYVRAIVLPYVDLCGPYDLTVSMFHVFYLENLSHFYCGTYGTTILNTEYTYIQYSIIH